MKIIGNTVGTGLPKPDLTQTDPKKGDFVHGKEEFLAQAGGGSGGGYYIPTVKMQDGGVLVFTFRGTSGMPDLPPQPVKIPVGIPVPETAEVGQFIKVSAVDEDGVVTATEAVDAPETAVAFNGLYGAYVAPEIRNIEED